MPKPPLIVPLDLPDDDRPRRTRDRNEEPPLSRSVYIALGILLGWLGVHNFYAGYTVRAILQLITGLSVPLLYLAMYIYSTGEAAARGADAEGGDFKPFDYRPLLACCGLMLVAALSLCAFVIRDLIVTKKDSRGRWMR